MTTALDNGAHPSQPPADADPFRDRLVDGLAASIGERGYRDSTVADEHAGQPPGHEATYQQNDGPVYGSLQHGEFDQQ